MRVVAVLATFNEERFIEACLTHYYKHGIEVFILDNGSEDNTINIAKPFLEKNLIGIESIPRYGEYDWLKILRAKENLVDRLDADWFMHADPDEFRVPPSSGQTLLEAITEVDAAGYNAINFMEYVFLPTREFPNHDSKDFQETMRWYYPFLPRNPHRLSLWKKQPRKWKNLKKLPTELIRNRRFKMPSVDLCSSGGHVVRFEGVNMYPIDFKMRHYLVLSLDHAIEKYVNKAFKEQDIDNLHGWRGRAAASDFVLPSSELMREYVDDDSLNPDNPRKAHIITSI